MPDSCVKCGRTATRQLQCTTCKGRWPLCRYCRTAPAVRMPCLCPDEPSFGKPAPIVASPDPWLTIAEQDADDEEEPDVPVSSPVSPLSSATSSTTPQKQLLSDPVTPSMS